MTPLFIDTSAWYPLADAGHPDHKRVAEALRTRIGDGAAVVTTNLVVAETQVLLLRRAGRTAAMTFLEAIRQPPNRIEYATPEREEASVSRWLRSYTDQRFSLADAVSFVVMEELGISEALTLDRNFAAAGFVMMPGRG
ncbi:MAG: PIN domain-containing protein [Acidobacteriota bacterium]|nr:PIN domain-containing protein [Acidobacteriota bacterium]